MQTGFANNLGKSRKDGNAMLSATDQVRTIAEELDCAIGIGKDVLGTLETVKPKNLTEKIGIFAKKIPDWKLLVLERRVAIDFIRQICTAELSIAEGKELCKKYIGELEDARRLINL
jgi:hypothetical protein